MSEAGDPLRRLIVAYEGGTLSAQAFCDRFETVFNFETNRAALTDRERQAFGQLLEVVIWFSPFEDERARIPNYVGPDEITTAVRAVRAMLER